MPIVSASRGPTARQHASDNSRRNRAHPLRRWTVRGSLRLPRSRGGLSGGLESSAGLGSPFTGKLRMKNHRHQVVFSHSLNARGRLIASGETEVVSPAKHKRDNAEAIFS